MITYIGGLYDGYNGQTAEIIGRSKQRKVKEYYKIKFANGQTQESMGAVLRKIEIEEEKVEEEPIE